MNEFSSNIKRLRIKSGLKQSEFAIKLNVTQQAVSSWENGIFPDIPVMCSIADFFNITIDELLYEPKVTINRKLHKIDYEFSNELIGQLNDNEKSQVELMIEFLVYKKTKENLD